MMQPFIIWILLKNLSRKFVNYYNDFRRYHILIMSLIVCWKVSKNKENLFFRSKFPDAVFETWIFGNFLKTHYDDSMMIDRGTKKPISRISSDNVGLRALLSASWLKIQNISKISTGIFQLLKTWDISM